MAIVIYPISDAPQIGNYLFSVSLDGTDYVIDLKYNAREDSWYFDVVGIEGNQIRSGLKCSSNWVPLRTMSNIPRPLGEIILIDTRLRPQDPTLEDIGNTVLLGYVEQISLS
jgi:hypothetical protein